VSTRSGVLIAVALVVAAVAMAAAGVSVLLPVLAVAAGVAVVAVPVARAHAERLALALAVIAVAAGSIAAVVRVVDHVSDARVTFRGKLDAGEINRTFAPTGPSGTGDPIPAAVRNGLGYLSRADGEMTRPHASGGDLLLWSIQELAPWLLAAIVLALLVPLLRAADRGDPFWSDATTRRLQAVGVLLLVGIPATALLRYLVAESVSGAGPYAAPVASPSFSLSVAQVLPGVLVLTLARVFQRGVELRDLERHTV
jgi:hypothetical protein